MYVKEMTGRQTPKEGDMDRTVSESALIQRINRVLAHKGERLSVQRPGQSRDWNACRYEVIDTHSNTLVCATNDLESLARDVGVMHEIETLRVD
jgi:hypothetical protein